MNPPYWPEGSPCPNRCAAQLHETTIYGSCDLQGPWQGWRVRGRVLVSPAGDRVTCDTLATLLMLRSVCRVTA
jgi:hypothetical protein